MADFEEKRNWKIALAIFTKSGVYRSIIHASFCKHATVVSP